MDIFVDLLLGRLLELLTGNLHPASCQAHAAVDRRNPANLLIGNLSNIRTRKEKGKK